MNPGAMNPEFSVRPSARWLGLAGLVLVIGAVASVVVEAIAAAAWDNPAYSYIDDKIAYLGSPYCGPYEDEVVCSPDWLAMLEAWLTNGLFVLVAGLVLGRLIGGRGGGVVLAVAVAETVGFALFSFFHDSPDARDDGTISLYFIGAGLVLIAGNVLPIVVGVMGRRAGLPRWLAQVSIALGAVGLLAAVVTLGWVPLGLAERISVYTFLLWQLLLGGWLLVRVIRPATSPATS